MIEKQCPQFSIFIINSLISTIILMLLYKADKLNILINSFMSLCISIYLLIGTGYCKWPHQWLTWVIVAISILYTICTLFILLGGFSPNDELDDDKVITFVTTDCSSKETMKANHGLNPWKCCNDCNEPDLEEDMENTSQQDHL